MAMALFSSPPTPTLPPSSSSSNPSIPHLNKPFLPLFSRPKKTLFLSHSISDNGAGIATSPPPPPPPPLPTEDAQETSPPAEELGSSVKKFDDPRWVNGTWDLKQFFKNGSTDWDAVIDAEARRRKFLENTPEPSDNADPVVFDTSIIPWWAWIKKYHLPEAELLNGRAAMVGFFMAYFVDSLTGVGLVDQMGNFFCKTLLLVAVSGVLLIRKNEDIETLKKLIDESTFYDKQWQATWKEDSNSGSKKD